MQMLLVLALLVDAEGKDGKAELKKFEGTWQLVSEILDGKEQPADHVKRIRWVFDDKGHWKVEDGGKVIFTGDMKVYPDRNPKEADSTLTKEGDRRGRSCARSMNWMGIRLSSAGPSSGIVRERSTPSQNPASTIQSTGV